MFDKELFYSLCEKYDVELSPNVDGPMIRTERGTLRSLTEGDIKDLYLNCQSYFDYSTINRMKTIHKQKAEYIAMDELAIAC